MSGTILASATLVVGVATTHIGGGPLNNDNQLVAAGYRGYLAGTMVNSLDKRSFFAGRVIDLGLPGGAGLFAGAATGYDWDCFVRTCYPQEEDRSDVVPILAPMYQYRAATVIVNANAISLALTLEL